MAPPSQGLEPPANPERFTMAFKLILSAKRKWRSLDGSNQLAEVIKGVPFKDGIKQIKHAA